MAHTRYTGPAEATRLAALPAAALRAVLREGYSAADFRADLMAGLVVGVVAWNMSEAKHFLHTLEVAPRNDVAVLLTCFGLTVLTDMVIGVGVGMVLGATLFMRRMAEVTEAGMEAGESTALPGPVPSGVVVYRVSGPLLFGAAQKAAGSSGSRSSIRPARWPAWSAASTCCAPRWAWPGRAIATMLAADRKILAVVDGSGRLVGVVDRADLLRGIHP